MKRRNTMRDCTFGNMGSIMLNRAVEHYTGHSPENANLYCVVSEAIAALDLGASDVIREHR